MQAMIVSQPHPTMVPGTFGVTDVNGFDRRYLVTEIVVLEDGTREAHCVLDPEDDPMPSERAGRRGWWS
jgi:hypothetical protein